LFQHRFLEPEARRRFGSWPMIEAHASYARELLLEFVETILKQNHI
jgi:hypothetical protein